MENLNKKPPKGILKQSSSFDTQVATAKHFTPRCSITSLGPATIVAEGEGHVEEDEGSDDVAGAVGGSGCSPKCHRKKSAKFDEMNILETLHPPDKDYGFMKIEEPKTPFNYYEGELEGGDSQSERKKEPLLDPEELAEKIKEKGIEPPKFFNDDDEEDEEVLDPEAMATNKIFESKRKAHYNEYFAVKLARQLMEKETEAEEDESCAKKFIPSEETIQDLQ